MPKFTAAEVEAALGVKASAQAELFADIVTDTRKITQGVLFVALRGERFNGENFVREAAEKGAAGAVVSEGCAEDNLRGLTIPVYRVADTLKAYQQLANFWRKKCDPQVIAITGSNGKTTTKDITAAVLGAHYSVMKTPANFNNEVGLPLTLLSLTAEHQAAVVEIGMRGLGQIAALVPVAEPDLAIVTNVGETHIELLGSLENIAKAKGELVEGVRAGGTVFLNADNEYVLGMKEKAAAGVRVVLYGIDNEACDVRGSEINTVGLETQFKVSFDGGEPQSFALPLVGLHNVYNALAALALARSLGLTAEEMQRGLTALAQERTGMRFECSEKNGVTIINDAYNASPMSMTAAIATLKSVAKGRRIAVLGDMLELGDYAEGAHRRVGKELAESGADVLLTRGELSSFTAEEARRAGMAQVVECASHEEAAARLKELLRQGDTVLFKGSRGMQMEKIIGLL